MTRDEAIRDLAELYYDGAENCGIDEEQAEHDMTAAFTALGVTLDELNRALAVNAGRWRWRLPFKTKA